ncbi:MAG: hypothetical protein U0X87_01475 [Anaerolineales bacterium]
MSFDESGQRARHRRRFWIKFSRAASTDSRVNIPLIAFASYLPRKYVMLMANTPAVPIRIIGITIRFAPESDCG